MKLAIVHPDFNTKGGAENIIFWLCEECAGTLGWEITVFSADFGAAGKRLSEHRGVKLKEISVPWLMKKTRVGHLLCAPFLLRRELKNFDCINVHNYPATLWVGLAQRLRRNKLPRIIWSCNEPPRFLYRKICNRHTPYALQLESGEVNAQLRVKILSRIKIGGKSLYKPFLRVVDRLAVRSFAKIMALSSVVAEQVREIYGVKNVQVFYLGIKEMDKEYAQDEIEGNYFITVCRLEPCKNIQNVLRAFALLKKKGKLKETQYCIVGAGPIEKYLKNLIADLKLENMVKMPGFLERRELLKYYRGCLAVIYVPYDEPYGLPYLEAAYFSKPALASDHGGPAELVKDRKSGWLVEPHNVEEIARKIEWFISNEKERKEMGRRAYEDYKREFTWQKYMARYLTQILQ